MTLFTHPWQLIPVISITMLSMRLSIHLFPRRGLVLPDSRFQRWPTRQRLRSNELDTTETELIAIAAPAITGLSIPSAAKGMPSTL